MQKLKCSGHRWNRYHWRQLLRPPSGQSCRACGGVPAQRAGPGCSCSHRPATACLWWCSWRPEHAPPVQAPAAGLWGPPQAGSSGGILQKHSPERCCRWTCVYCKEKHAGLAPDTQRRDASLLEGICMRTNVLKFPFPFCLLPGVPRGKSGGDSACTT